MAHAHTNITRTTTHTRSVEPDVSTTDVERVEAEPVSGPVMAARVVSYLLGVLETILVIRFILALLGANRTNDFAQFIFNLSHPFVSPFFGLFGYTPTYGASHVELYTLVAMAVYGLVAWGIIALIRLPRDEDEL